MVQVTVTASVKVAGGPTVPLGATLEPQSYTFASVTLDATGGTDPEKTVDLLPDGGDVVLLAISARGVDSKPASVALTPTNGATDGDELTVVGTLLVANSGVLAALVPGGPRTVTLTNTAAAPVTVDLLVGHDA